MKTRMMLMTVALVTAGALAGCGESEVNAPTDPAAPIVTPDEPAAIPIPGRTPTMPGRGPTSFVGRWAAQASWCANTRGPQRPIQITTTRFEGYENGCDITEIGEVQGGYVAYVTCQAEGETNSERLRMSVASDILTLTWIDRSDMRTELKRCPAPAPAAAAPAAPAS